MGSKLIELQDGMLVEVEVSDDDAREISGGVADKVETSFSEIGPLIKKVCQPISETWKELNRDMEVNSAEVQLGFSFEGEGNLFVTKAKAGASISVKLTLKPKE